MYHDNVVHFPSVPPEMLMPIRFQATVNALLYAYSQGLEATRTFRPEFYERIDEITEYLAERIRATAEEERRKVLEISEHFLSAADFTTTEEEKRLFEERIKTYVREALERVRAPVEQLTTDLSL